MSERYSRLYSLQENLYAYGAPVVIAAGALLKDNQTGKVLAQLKLKNIAEKSIKAAKVSILPFDTLGNPIGSAVEHQYLDLSANRDEDFGAKSPIFLPDAATRRFSVEVTEVAFADNTVWKVNGAPWEAMPKQKILAATLQEQELVKQYKMKYGESCVYTPDTQKDLWRCTCGSINRLKESQCCNCKRSRSALMAIDLNELREERDARLAAEAKKAAEKKAAAEVRAKKLKKTAAIVILVAAVAIAVGSLLKQVVIPTVKYNQAVSLLEDGQYDEAIAAFEAMDGYKDSTEQITECNYRSAVALMNAGDYDEAVAAFKAMAGYKDSTEQITECNYRSAVALMNAGDYDEAVAAFKAMDGYKDSAEYVLSCISSALKNAQVGDYVIFGAYEQDNDTFNGKEEIEWLVLDRQGDQILVISKYALDCKQYNTEYKNITWKTCSLRKWLNNNFVNAAFSAEEQAMIPTVTVAADKNPNYSTNLGNATEDQVFLLSITEANKYFTSNSARQCVPTDYAVANGVSKSGNGKCWWWLRSPGRGPSSAANVSSGGGVYEGGYDVSDGSDAVRPALWINLNAQ